MKKFILFMIVAAVVFQTSTVSAQRKGFSAGIEGGPGIRTLYGKGASELKSTMGFAAGVTAQYNFSDVFGIRTGISYDLKGAIEKDIVFTDNAGNELGTGEREYNFKYLQVPMMFRATISMDNFSVFGNLGMFGAILLEEEYKLEGPLDTDHEETDNGYISGFDLGSAIGIGAMFTIKDMFNISGEIRSYLGLKDINEYQYSDETRTQSTMLLIGLSHNFGKKEEAKPHE